MDPEATLLELLEAVQARAWDRVDELAGALLDWLEKQGFPPLVVGPRELGVEWHRAMATFVCHMAQSKVRDARKRRERRAGA